MINIDIDSSNSLDNNSKALSNDTNSIHNNDELPFIHIYENFEDIDLTLKKNNNQFNNKNNNKSYIKIPNTEFTNDQYIKQIQIDKRDFKISLILFFFGIIFIIPLIFNVRYLKSNNPKAKKIAIVSIILFVPGIILLFLFILYCLFWVVFAAIAISTID